MALSAAVPVRGRAARYRAVRGRAGALVIPDVSRLSVLAIRVIIGDRIGILLRLRVSRGVVQFHRRSERFRQRRTSWRCARVHAAPSDTSRLLSRLAELQAASRHSVSVRPDRKQPLACVLGCSGGGGAGEPRPGPPSARALGWHSFSPFRSRSQAILTEGQAGLEQAAEPVRHRSLARRQRSLAWSVQAWLIGSGAILLCADGVPCRVRSQGSCPGDGHIARDALSLLVRPRHARRSHGVSDSPRACPRGSCVAKSSAWPRASFLVLDFPGRDGAGGSAGRFDNRIADRQAHLPAAARSKPLSNTSLPARPNVIARLTRFRYASLTML